MSNEQTPSRVAIVTGAGRGLGRAYAMALAQDGVAVVVNDLGGALDGSGKDSGPAAEVVAEIEAAGGQAVASHHDVADWDEAGAMVALAVETFGRLDVLVNNAGILRDKMFANMSQEDWDAVVRVHLKGHAAPAHHAMAHWRAEVKAGREVAASVVSTTSLAGMLGNFGQANYASAKMAVVGLSHTLAREGERYGIRSNAVSPSARTRIEENLGNGEGATYDVFNPANVAPLICWLARADCPATGQVFHAYGRRIEVLNPTAIAVDLQSDEDWTVDSVGEALADRLPRRAEITDFVPEFNR